MSWPYSTAVFAAIAFLAFAGPARAEAPEPTVTVHFEGNRRSFLVSATGDAPDSWTTVCTHTCTTDLTPGGTFRAVRNGVPSEPFVLRGANGDDVAVHPHTNVVLIFGYIVAGAGAVTLAGGLLYAILPVLPKINGDPGDGPVDARPFVIGTAIGLPALSVGLLMVATSKRPVVTQSLVDPREQDEDDDRARRRQERRHRDADFSSAAWVLPVLAGHF